MKNRDTFYGDVDSSLMMKQEMQGCFRFRENTGIFYNVIEKNPGVIRSEKDNAYVYYRYSGWFVTLT